jgi:isopentenyl-diphosphate Delta-isomerase
MTMQDEVILVDDQDNPIGTAEKMEAHCAGKLHRAFSIFVFNSEGQLLMQQRAKQKYHSGGLWSNTCCSHPRPGESIVAAAHRRLKEEMGFDCDLRDVHQFVYRTEFDNGLTEHEYDHVLIGNSDAAPTVDPAEVGDWKWVDLRSLKSDMAADGDKYTHWLRVSLGDVISRLRDL